MQENMRQTGGYLRIHTVRFQKTRVTRARVMLVFLITSLMVKGMSAQMTKAQKELEELISNKSPEVQVLMPWVLSYLERHYQMTPLQNISESLVTREARDLSGKGPNPTVTITRVETFLGKAVQLPCQCPEEYSGTGTPRVEWEDSQGRNTGGDR
ncbi:hypothetical protein EYF80_000291 [Liparis tanakae]|uniref:Uncharacterized protein n=1 Tax=Liparis tanakae TaxID=230148 RepID=A0A4Z2JJ70_9TELE|nr:hypothetical protein EYF80_000291 [Liparis tanakae]